MKRFEVIALPEMVGKAVGEVQKMCEEKYPGRLAKEEDLDAFEEEYAPTEDRAEYFAIGSKARDYDNDWSVPYARWHGSGFDRDVYWLGGVWGAECRVVILSGKGRITME